MGILLVIASGGYVKNLYPNLSDAEIVGGCMESLRKVFGKKVPKKCIWSYVTRWGDDLFSKMSYSYMSVGSSGVDYDYLAEPVDGRVFFAGEATNKHFPQTATGASLSGMREASRIVSLLK